jgi:serine/threonine-protein kinase HipA
VTAVLDVYLHGALVATVEQLRPRRYQFVYEDAWRETAGVPVSLSLPVAQKKHSAPAVFNFIDNLLPDSQSVREAWAREAGLDDVEPLQLLAVHGADVAGALEFYRHGDLPRQAGALQALKESAIAGRIRAVRAGLPDPAMPEGGAGRFSLGGAQGKFALALHAGQWFAPSGAHPSTHIFKPKVIGLEDGEIVEHVTMSALTMLRVPTADTAVIDFGDEYSLVVTRFDRVLADSGRVSREHQEDLLQASGMPRLKKYQKDGGPGYRNVLMQLDRIPNREAAEFAKSRFVEALFASWFLLNTDAHGKNFSIHHHLSGFDLTPMYDFSSFLPYVLPREGGTRGLHQAFDDTHMSMSIAGSYEAGSMGGFEWAAVAREAGLHGEAFLDWGVQLASAAPAVFRFVAEQLPTRYKTPIIEMLLERLDSRVEQVIAVLEREIRV